MFTEVKKEHDPSQNKIEKQILIDLCGFIVMTTTNIVNSIKFNATFWLICSRHDSH